MKMAIALKFGAVSLATALAMTWSGAFGKNVREVASVAPQNGLIRQEINLSHLNFLEATVPYPASPVNGLYTFNPGQPLSVWYPYANEDAQTRQYTPVGAAVPTTKPRIRGAKGTITNGPSATAKHLADMLAAGIADLHAGFGSTGPYERFLDYSQSFRLWHGYGSNQVQALAISGKALHNPSGITGAENGAEGLLVPVSGAYGPAIEGLEPGPADQTQIAYGVTWLFQDYLTLGDVTHSRRFLEMAGVAFGWYFDENDEDDTMYNPANGVTLDGINSSGTLNQNSGAESTIEGLRALEEAAEQPDILSFLPDGPAVAESLPLTLPAHDGLITHGKVVTPSSAWTGQGQFTDGSHVLLQPGSQDVLYSDLAVPGTNVVQVEASPDHVTETVEVAIGGQSGTVQIPGVSGNSSSAPVYLTNASASATTPVYQGLDPVTLSLPATATQPLVIDSVILQPVLEWDTWPTASGTSTTAWKNMSDSSQTATTWSGRRFRATDSVWSLSVPSDSVSTSPVSTHVPWAILKSGWPALDRATYERGWCHYGVYPMVGIL